MITSQDLLEELKQEARIEFRQLQELHDVYTTFAGFAL